MDSKKLEAMYNPATCAAVVKEELQQSAEVSKIALKFAAQQNAFALNAFKKVLNGTPFASLATLPVFALAGPALEGSLAIQKNQVELALEQGTAVVEAIQESGTDPEKASTEFSKVFQSAFERSIAAQNSMFEFATQQANAMCEAFKQPISGNEADIAAETAQRAYENALNAQKQMLSFFNAR